MRASFSRSGPLVGTLSVPGDKSISHRAAMIASVAEGVSRISGYSDGADCASTLSVLETLGIVIERREGALLITGCGGRGFMEPGSPLDCGNSGTTMRLMSGLLASYPIQAVLDGDESLRGRPMRRIAEPLAMMGASLTPGDEAWHPPLTLRGAQLKGISYSPPVASAQVKSAVLLAGLRAGGRTTVCESAPTRDHTERMLKAQSISVETEGGCVSVEPGIPRPMDMRIPGDLSSAAFFAAAALLVPGSQVSITGVGLNPSRTGFIQVMRNMGASIDISLSNDEGEPSGEIRVKHSDLHGTDISPVDVALAIDEVTLIALLAARAEGRTVITGAGELRHKESDRLHAAAVGLRTMGACVDETGDGLVIEGPSELTGARVDAGGDHRIAMMFAVAGLAAEGETLVDGWEWTEISYPGFERELISLQNR